MSTPTSGEARRSVSADRLRRARGWVADTALEGVRVEVAVEEDDHRGAFRVVHDSYVALGYIERQPSRMWLQPHHCTGRSTVLVARRAGRIVGTATVFVDGGAGLPVEGSYPTDARRCREEGVVFEIGSLAVVPEERGTGLAVLVQTAALYFGSRVRGATHCLITIPPSRVHYYAALFGFVEVRQDRTYHGFRRPAVLMSLALSRFEVWSRVYPDPPAGWHTVRSLMESSSLPRTDFSGRSTLSPAQLEAFLPGGSSSGG